MMGKIRLHTHAAGMHTFLREVWYHLVDTTKLILPLFLALAVLELAISYLNR